MRRFLDREGCVTDIHPDRASPSTKNPGFLDGEEERRATPLVRGLQYFLITRPLDGLLYPVSIRALNAEFAASCLSTAGTLTNFDDLRYSSQ